MRRVLVLAAGALGLAACEQATKCEIPRGGATPAPVVAAAPQPCAAQVETAVGFTSAARQDKLIVEAEAAAKSEVTEAADSEEGKFDLPLRQDTTATGVSKGGPLGYSEVSPYTWTDRQREALSYGE